MIGLMICIGIVAGLLAFDLAAWRWGANSTEVPDVNSWERGACDSR